MDERDGQGSSKDMEMRSKLRWYHEQGRGGGGGATHCFNCNKDGHFQASCTNPPSATTAGKKVTVICIVLQKKV
jgi:hypothetical protein